MISILYKIMLLCWGNQALLSSPQGKVTLTDIFITLVLFCLLCWCCTNSPCWPRAVVAG